jgi:hypothetical protein
VEDEEGDFFVITMSDRDMYQCGEYEVTGAHDLR